MTRVLFVESDDVRERSYTASLNLSDTDWIVLHAATAEKALELQREDPFDLVVTASRLEGRSGIQLLSQFKERSPETIRFLVAEDSEKNEFRSLNSDAQQILLNPLDQEKLTQKINRALSLRELFSDQAILKLGGKRNPLPPLPRVFKEVTEKLQEPDASLGDIADIISEDIVMSSKLLKLSNSALFNLSEPARNISQAVSLLGSATVSSLVFSLGIRESFALDAKFERFAEEINRHSMECARMTSNILFTWGAQRDLIDKAIFCAIAHDLGKLLLARSAPDLWQEILAEVEKGERPDVEIEKERLGVCHTDAAAYLLAQWGFLNDEIIAVAFHHQPSRVEETTPGVLCALHLAENICDTHLHGNTFDWPYLEKHGVTEEDVIAFQALKES